MKVRPGQVYWNQRAYFSVVVYAVTGDDIRVVVVKPPAPRRTIYSATWKKGVPEHYGLQYDPPKRSEE